MIGTKDWNLPSSTGRAGPITPEPLRILSSHDFTLMAACLIPAALLAWALIRLAASSAGEARRHGVTDEQFAGLLAHSAQVEVVAGERTSAEDSDLAVATT